MATTRRMTRAAAKVANFALPATFAVLPTTRRRNTRARKPAAAAVTTASTTPIKTSTRMAAPCTPFKVATVLKTPAKLLSAFKSSPAVKPSAGPFSPLIFTPNTGARVFGKDITNSACRNKPVAAARRSSLLQVVPSCSPKQLKTASLEATVAAEEPVAAPVKGVEKEKEEEVEAEEEFAVATAEEVQSVFDFAFDIVEDFESDEAFFESDEGKDLLGFVSGFAGEFGWWEFKGLDYSAFDVRQAC